MNPDKTTANALYLVCDYNANTHCLAFSSVDAISIALGTISVICAIFVNCPDVWRRIKKGSGKHTFWTLQNEMAYSGSANPWVHYCMGANPTPGDTNNGVYFARPSQCFGHAQTSWLVVPSTGNSFLLFNAQALSYGRNFRLINLNLRVGAYEYVVPDTVPGYTKYGLYQLGSLAP